VRAAPCERGSCRTAIEQDGGEPGGGPIPWRPRWAGLRQTASTSWARLGVDARHAIPQKTESRLTW